jgi:hypothetical protein
MTRSRSPIDQWHDDHPAEVLARRWGLTQQRDGTWRGACPCCGGSDRFGLWPDAVSRTGRVKGHCRSGCGVRGDGYHIARVASGLDHRSFLRAEGYRAGGASRREPRPGGGAAAVAIAVEPLRGDAGERIRAALSQVPIPAARIDPDARSEPHAARGSRSPVVSSEGASDTGLRESMIDALPDGLRDDFDEIAARNEYERGMSREAAERAALTEIGDRRHPQRE